ncbi:MAG: hypothetical protein ACYCW6_03990 [Candidatus Xenobia bacterium]
MLKQLFERKEAQAAATISGLIEVATRWLARDMSDRTLQASLETVQARVTDGYDRTRLELAQTDIAEGLREHAVGAVEALSDVLAAIASMHEGLRQHNAGQVEEALSLLTASAQAFGVANAAVDAWKRSQVPACPLCGRRQAAREMFCTACDIHLVIPDNTGASFPSVTVGPLHLAVYRACVSVADGAITITEFLDTLPPLEERLFEMVQLVGASQEHVGEADAAVAARDLQSIYEQVELTREGIGRLRRFADTHAIADINLGWSWIARAAINLQQLIPSVQQVACHVAGEQQAMPPQLDVHDSVLIGVDED